MCRSEWLARGSALALTGCTGSATGAPHSVPDATAVEASSMSPEASPGNPMDARDDIPRDVASDVADVLVVDSAGSDATADGPRWVACGDGGLGLGAVGQGKFPCTCPSGLGLDGGLLCDRATEYCLLTSSISGDTCQPIANLCNPAPYFQCDSGILRCACLGLAAGYCASGQETCVDDDAGGVTITAACYGAPPARLTQRSSASPGIA